MNAAIQMSREDMGIKEDVLGELHDAMKPWLSQEEHEVGSHSYFIREEDAPLATFAVLLPFFAPTIMPSAQDDDVAFEHRALAMVWSFFEEIRLDARIDVGVDSRWLERVTSASGASFLRVCGTLRLRD